MVEAKHNKLNQINMQLHQNQDFVIYSWML